jgi:hypothetical protein
MVQTTKLPRWLLDHLNVECGTSGYISSVGIAHDLGLNGERHSSGRRKFLRWLVWPAIPVIYTFFA